MYELIKFYRDYFDLNDAGFSRIDHRDTMIAVVYKIERSSPLILKICTRKADFYREMHFLDTLAGLLPVPRVLNAINPSEDYPGAILMEYLEGNLISESDWTPQLAHEVGEKLATLHAMRNDFYGDVTDLQNSTESALAYFQDKFFEELEECAGHLPEEIISRCRDYYQANHELLSRVDGPCWVHRDFRPGNMIVHNGKLQGIIDWASGRSGFAEQDFCSMEHRNWPENPEHKQSLLAGYASIRKIPDFQTIMPLLRLGRALAVIGFTVQSGTWKGKDREIYQYNRNFVDSL